MSDPYVYVVFGGPNFRDLPWRLLPAFLARLSALCRGLNAAGHEPGQSEKPAVMKMASELSIGCSDLSASALVEERKLESFFWVSWSALHVAARMCCLSFQRPALPPPPLQVFVCLSWGACIGCKGSVGCARFELQGLLRGVTDLASNLLSSILGVFRAHNRFPKLEARMDT